MIPRRTRVGVVVAGAAVHVCLRQGRSLRYTAEPIQAPGPEGRREALRAACRRLRIRRRAPATTALPGERLVRRRLPTPPRRHRRERSPLARVWIRRQLPPPASAWRYRLETRAHGAVHLHAARAADLQAAQRFLWGAGLRPHAAYGAPDALRRRTLARLRRDPHLPQTPGALLAAALTERPRRDGPINLARGRSPAPGRAALGPRQLAGLGILAPLALLAGHTHFGDEPAEPPSSPTGRTSAEPAEQRDAAPEEVEESPVSDDDSALPGNLAERDATRRAVPDWLEALAAARPRGTRLQRIELSERLHATATAATAARAQAYLETLRGAPELGDVRLEQLDEAREKGIALRLVAEPDTPSAGAAPPDKPQRPVADAIDRLAESLAEGGLSLRRLERRPADRDGVVPVELRLAGDYTRLDAWLREQAEGSRPRGLRRLRITPAPERRVEATLVLGIPSPEALP